MTAQVNRNHLSARIDAISGKARLLSYAIEGFVHREKIESLWTLRDALDALCNEIDAVADEVHG